MSEREHNRDHSTEQAGVRLPRWVARPPSGGEIATDARTRSEARARFKALFEGKIPAGTVITREELS